MERGHGDHGVLNRALEHGALRGDEAVRALRPRVGVDLVVDRLDDARGEGRVHAVLPEHAGRLGAGVEAELPLHRVEERLASVGDLPDARAGRAMERRRGDALAVLREADRPVADGAALPDAVGR